LPGVHRLSSVDLWGYSLTWKSQLMYVADTTIVIGLVRLLKFWGSATWSILSVLFNQSRVRVRYG